MHEVCKFQSNVLIDGRPVAEICNERRKDDPSYYYAASELDMIQPDKAGDVHEEDNNLRMAALIFGSPNSGCSCPDKAAEAAENLLSRIKDSQGNIIIFDSGH